MTVARKQSRNEKGYLLLSVMLLMTLMLIGLTVVLPRISQQIKRDKEEELIHRGNEYVSAVRKFYRKFGRYPLSIEQLENTNNMRFLRKRFKDPMTGKDDWHIVRQGEIVPLAGSGATTNVNGPPRASGSNSGSSTSSGTGSGPGIGTDAGSSPGSGLGSTTTQPAGSGQNSQNSGGFSLGSGPGSSNSQGNSGSVFGNPQAGGGPMAGVASILKDQSIKIRKEKDHYNDWLFYYDPVQEQQQLGGGMNIPNNPNNINPGTGTPKQ